MPINWIKFETTTSDKPEVWAIASDLGIDPDAVVGKLLRVWAWFDEQTESGNAPSVTAALLDRRVGVSGFVTAVVRAGWLSDDGEKLQIVNFERHNGETAKTRALTAKRVAKHKAGNVNGNAPSVTSALPREEKSRVEYLELSKDNSCPPRCVETDKPDFVFATQKGTWHLPMAKLDEYRATYSFDVASELAKASQWLRDNSGRRPRSAKGVVSFLTRWLNRVADKPGSTPYKPPADRKKDPKLDYELRRSRLIKTARSEGWDEDRLRSAIDQIRPKEAANAH